MSDEGLKGLQRFSEQIAKSLSGPDMSKLARASAVSLPRIQAADFALAATSMKRLSEQVMAPSRELSRIAETMLSPAFSASLPSVKALAEEYTRVFPTIRELAVDAAKLPRLEIPNTSGVAAAALAAQVSIPRSFTELASSHRVLADMRSWARAETLVSGSLFPNRDRLDALIRDVAALAIEPDVTLAAAAELAEVDVDDVDGLAAVSLVVSEMSPAQRRDLALALGGLLVAIYMYVVALSTDEKLATSFGKTLLVFVCLFGVYSSFLKGIESYGGNEDA